MVEYDPQQYDPPEGLPNAPWTKHLNDLLGPDYDAAVVAASPAAMEALAAELSQLEHDVFQELEAIQNKLKALRLSWTGKTAREREEVTDDWVIVMLELFGAPHAPAKGVFGTIIKGILTAAGNLSAAEDGVAKAFRRFANALESNGHTDPYAQPDDQLDTDQTAITAFYLPDIAAYVPLGPFSDA